MGSAPYIGRPGRDLSALVVYPTARQTLRCAYSSTRELTAVITNAFISGIGPLELAIVLLIVILLVGGKRLPQLGRQLGAGMREFKDSVTKRTDSQWDDDSESGRPEATAALGRPAGEETPVDGEVMRERS
jgi:sec-independent protein translocase protein TatA